MGGSITQLEYVVLEKFTQLISKDMPAPNQIEVVDRHQSPVGFMTNLKFPESVGSLWNKRVYDRVPDARVLGTGEILGFLIFFNPDNSIALEGYVNGKVWPAVDFPIEFLPTTCE